MNKDYILQDMIESERLTKPKKARTSTNQLQLHVASIYQDIAQIFEKNNTQIQLPREVPTATERVTLLKQAIIFLLKNNTSVKGKQNNQSQDQGQCSQCSNYEGSLQKLENEIRQHIRVQQQLKIYHDSLEERLEQGKKQTKELNKKIEQLERKVQLQKKKTEIQKKKLDEVKSFSTSNSEKCSKLEMQNEKLRIEIKHLKLADQKVIRKINGDDKENKNDSLYRNFTIRRDQKEDERKSVEKRVERPESTEKWRASMNTKSTRVLPNSQKLIQQKNKEERRKVIQSKIQYRR